MQDTTSDRKSAEEKAFEKLRYQIRNERSKTSDYWKQVRSRYVYQGRQYTVQEVKNYFMTASFGEIRRVAEEIGVNWRAIGEDVMRMADVLETVNALRLEDTEGLFAEIREPFAKERDLSRLFFDFSIMISCLKKTDNLRILDFAGGTGWVAEYLNRAGFDVYIFDIEPSTLFSVEGRINADARLNGSRLHPDVCDAHHLNIYGEDYFGNIVCFDSLHHMSDFNGVFTEMYRIIEPGGRAAFVEPGANHSKAEETRNFMKKIRSEKPSWIERDIVLDEINKIVTTIGFKDLRIKPFLGPEALDFTLEDWKSFLENPQRKDAYFTQLQSFNYQNRVIFYVEKPSIEEL